MTSFSSRTLAKAHDLLLEVYSIPETEELRRVIPARVRQLIPCDRVSFNEFDFSLSQPVVVTAPVPSYWPRLGAVFQAHMAEHPLFMPLAPVKLHRTWSCSDTDGDDAWARSTLYHEYYRPIGVRAQLGVVLSSDGTRRINIGCNRESGSFRDRDRRLLELLSPHFAAALRNAARVKALRNDGPQLGSAPHEGPPLVVLNRSKNAVTWFSPTIPGILRRYFDHTCSSDEPLPPALASWIQAQVGRMDSRDSAFRPPAPFIVTKGQKQLSTRLVQWKADETIVLFEERVFEERHPDKVPLLTSREKEILHWISEGKRNTEIAQIVGTSPRTIEKHTANIFSKLGVETRTAAARWAFDFNLGPHA
ncbi:MAG: LuxR C-terminal-related transcriptional regulator [Opitutaceae bacterium]